MVQTLIKQKLVSKQKSNEPCAVVIGKCGAGKTTLAKKLCNKKHESDMKNPGTQQEFDCYHADCYEHVFSLIDTPATDSSTKVYKHAVLLRESLTKSKINTIFFIIKYDGRFEKMIEDYFQLQPLVSKYASKAVVIISYWEQSKDPENEFNEICEFFAEECPNVCNLIAYSEQVSNSDVASSMYSCMSNMDEEELVITDEEFNLNFNLYETKSSMKKLFEQYQKKVNLIVQENIEIINSMKSESAEEKHEVSRTIIDKVKRELEELMQNYREEHADIMHPLDRDALLAKMERENATMYNEFADKVTPLMSSNLSNDETNTNEGKCIVQNGKNPETRQDGQQEFDQMCNPKDMKQDNQEKILQSSNLRIDEQTG
ncbi:unnamed protein product [Adineta steineri]|uniref:G domain-containing protein n=1 Tax=Adineta steineri TaxID=433720 RepID=A0A813PS12_9BILA|nr:unnamed protein product [Adineta steineri]